MRWQRLPGSEGQIHKWRQGANRRAGRGGQVLRVGLQKVHVLLLGGPGEQTHTKRQGAISRAGQVLRVGLQKVHVLLLGGPGKQTHTRRDKERQGETTRRDKETTRRDKERQGATDKLQNGETRCNSCRVLVWSGDRGSKQGGSCCEGSR